MTAPQLVVVAYHYVRDLPRSRFPRLKGLLLDTFARQLDMFDARYEMATLESAGAFLRGAYRPARDLCLLTFDDGLKEHCTDVLPLLAERGIQGCFFPATACLEGDMAPVHQIHFLMAAGDLTALTGELTAALASTAMPVAPIAEDELRRRYPWDSLEAATFEYTLNFLLPPALREAIVTEMFTRHLGDARTFARELYLNWDDLRAMQADGMVVGGHSHAHRALSALGPEQQLADIGRCATLLRGKLIAQDEWPFAYPYGWYNDDTQSALQQHGFSCAFTVEAGPNQPGHPRFALRRFDTVQLLPGHSPFQGVVS